MDKLDHLGWVVSSSYEIGGARFAISSTSHAFGEWLRETLGAYEVDDVEDFLYSVVVPDAPVGERAKSKDFYILYKSSSAIVRTLDPVTLVRGLTAELEGLRLHQRDDAVYVHASAMRIAGKPTLIPSMYTPALSKVGRRLAKYEASLPGSMTVAIDLQTSEVVPVRPSLELPDGALERVGELFPTRGADGLFFVEEPAAFAAFVVPAREVGTPLQPAPRGYALASISNRVLNFEQVGGAGLRALGRFVERTPCYELAWGDSSEAVKQLSGALQGKGGVAE
jgi:hypothetical protein